MTDNDSAKLENRLRMETSTPGKPAEKWTHQDRAKPRITELARAKRYAVIFNRVIYGSQNRYHCDR